MCSPLKSLLCHGGGSILHLISGTFLLFSPSSCPLFSIPPWFYTFFFVISRLITSPIVLESCPSLINHRHLLAYLLVLSVFLLSGVCFCSALRLIFVTKLNSSSAGLDLNWDIWNNSVSLGTTFLLIPLSLLLRMTLNSLLQTSRSISTILFAQKDVIVEVHTPEVSVQDVSRPVRWCSYS